MYQSVLVTHHRVPIACLDSGHQGWYASQTPCQDALRPPSHLTESNPRSGPGEDVDVSVFRFTLGIPGFDDKYVPRVIGAVGLLLLAVNHVLGAQPPPAAQTASEVVGGILAALCIVVPLVEDRLSELQPGRGRAAGEAVQGSVNTFALASQLSEQQKKVLYCMAATTSIYAGCVIRIAICHRSSRGRRFRC